MQQGIARFFHAARARGTELGPGSFRRAGRNWGHLLFLHPMNRRRGRRRYLPDALSPASYLVGRAASPFAAVCMDSLRKRNGTAILPQPFGAAGRGLPALPAYGHTISESALPAFIDTPQKGPVRHNLDRPGRSGEGITRTAVRRRRVSQADGGGACGRAGRSS